MQVYLDQCAYKIVDKQTIYYLGDNVLKTDKDQVLSILSDRIIGINKEINPGRSNNSKECM